MSRLFHRAVSSGSGHVGARVRGRPTVRVTLLIHSPAGGHGPLPPLAAVHVLVRESAGLRFFGVNAMCHVGVTPRGLGLFPRGCTVLRPSGTRSQGFQLLYVLPHWV